jgi:hypothetical protein
MNNVVEMIVEEIKDVFEICLATSAPLTVVS